MWWTKELNKLRNNTRRKPGVALRQNVPEHRESAGTPTEGRMYYDHRGNENNSNKSVGDVLGSANTGNSDGVCSPDGRILPKAKSEKPRNRA